MSVARAVRPDWLTRDRFPFESRFAEIAGNTGHYVDEGAGPTLLMLHGKATWSFVYRHSIGLLRDPYRLPMTTRDRREAAHSFPKAIVGSTPFLATVEAGLEGLAHRPVLLCWGDKDIAFREKERARFATIFPRARTIALSGAGHCVQEESPAELAAAICAWWPAEVEAEQ